MYKYVFSGPGTINFKTPKVNSLDEIKKVFNQYPDHIESHLEYPNGLIIDSATYCDRVEYVTNKRLIVLEDCSIGFED